MTMQINNVKFQNGYFCLFFWKKYIGYFEFLKICYFQPLILILFERLSWKSLINRVSPVGDFGKQHLLFLDWFPMVLSPDGRK